MGLIGAGGWEAMHARTYAVTHQAELLGITDLDIDRAKVLANQFGAKPYPSWEDLLADDSIDAVSVVTPDFAHEEILLAAAKAGKHILAEKPLAMSVEACQRIIAAAEQSSIKLMVDFHARWSPPIHRAWESVRAGEIGTPRHIYYRLNDCISVPTEMLSWAAKSSVLWFVGSHAIDTVCWLVGDEVSRVYGISRKGILAERGIDTPDYYFSMLEFRRGATAVIENSWIVPNSAMNLVDVKCEFVGTEGALYVDQSHHRAVERYTNSKSSFPDVFVMPSVFGVQQGFAAESIKHFVDAVANDKPLLVTGQDGLRATRIITAVEESIRMRQPIDLDA
jgi:predicted dehydrogenase